MLKSLASSVLGINDRAPSNEPSDGIELDEAIKQVAHDIVGDIKQINRNKESYRSRISVSIAKEKVSATLSDLLSLVS